MGRIGMTLWGGDLWILFWSGIGASITEYLRYVPEGITEFVGIRPKKLSKNVLIFSTINVFFGALFGYAVFVSFLNKPNVPVPITPILLGASWIKIFTIIVNIFEISYRYFIREWI